MNSFVTFEERSLEDFGVEWADKTSACPTEQSSFRQSSSKAVVVASVDYDEATITKSFSLYSRY